MFDNELCILTVTNHIHAHPLLYAWILCNKFHSELITLIPYPLLLYTFTTYKANKKDKNGRL